MGKGVGGRVLDGQQGGVMDKRHCWRQGQPTKERALPWWYDVGLRGEEGGVDPPQSIPPPELHWISMSPIEVCKDFSFFLRSQ